MDAQQLLLDLHTRCHASLRLYLDHCGMLSDGNLDRAFGAERYWISVPRGAMDASEDEADAASMDAAERFRRSVFAATEAYLHDLPAAALATPQAVTPWGGADAKLAPVHVLLRTQAHLFHRMGRIAAMCRLLGHPIPDGMDLPVR